jgi:AraC-like DNA-binding protein
MRPMVGIEPNSPVCPRCTGNQHGPGVTRIQHPDGQVLQRHRHDTAFLAIVLAGRYLEAGDTGRHRVEAGDVIIHEKHESHLDLIGAHGADVLVLPCATAANMAPLGSLPDPDLVARTAERSLDDALAIVGHQIKPRPLRAEDWPDELAASLIQRPDLSLREWAESRGLHPGSLSRGFRQLYGLTPARFATTAKVRRALRGLSGGSSRLCDVAAGARFSDQSHMTRSMVKLIGVTPARAV